jgi:D-alanyl-lipoteichoic acid acyltransferase DltB (MBOAT superfamily)
MIFNSIDFFIFFVVVFSLYYFVIKEKTKLQNILLLVASYVFYAWADWKILPLLMVSTICSYGLGIAIFEAKTDKRKQLLTILGVVLGIGTLLYFKYFNFFISSFKDLFESFGLQINLHTFKIILPVGISFYTFRLLSYMIDIQREKFEPTRNIITFATYVAFFPCILSGPIDRPATLIPQLQSKRVFNYSLAVDGMRQILWGLFKKVVVADNCAVYVNLVFSGDYQTQTSSTLLFAAVFYSFQMYADFSGYSDMAIGVAKLFGFRVTHNFDYPFFAQNIAEYWRKWHISLTSWLTDYIFMPLNIKWRDWGNWGTIASIMITFILIGLWHGDNWKFAFFGLYHGLLYIPLILSGAMFKKNKIVTYGWGFPKPKVLFNILLTFSLVTLGNMIFRADSLGQAFEYMGGIIDVRSIFLMQVEKILLLKSIFVIVCMMIVEWLERKNQFGLEKLGMTWKPIFRYAMYYAILLLIFLSMGKEQVFIYFQF